MTTQLKLFADPKIPFAKLNRPYFLYVYSEQDCTYIPGESLLHLQVTQGKLHLNGIPILKPRITANSVSWLQRTAKHSTSGYLLFNKDGVTAHGNITFGSCPKTATAHTVMATAIPPAVYTTQITQQRYPADTDPNTLPAKAWQPGLELQLGYQYDQGMTQPLVRLAQQDMDSRFDLLTNGKNKLRITLDLKDDAAHACSNPALYLAAQITLSPWADTFTGTVSQTGGDRADDAGNGVYLWKGLVSSPCQTLQPSVEAQLSLEDLVQDSPDDPPQLNIDDLVSLLPDDDVTALSHAFLVENMKWTMGQRDYEAQWLRDFFAQTPPVIEKSRIDLIQPNLSWYQDNFAVAYLSKGLSTSPDGTTQPPIQLDDTQKSKLDYYLKNGMAQSNEYNTQSDGLFTQAYLQVQKPLPEYLADTTPDAQGRTGGQKWAAQVLDALTTPAKLNQVMISLQSHFDMTLANNYTSLLATLDPSGTYAQQYQERLFARLTLQTGLYGTIIRDEATTMNWLPQALKSLVATVIPTTPTSLKDPIPSDFQSAVEDVKSAFEYFGDATETAKAIYDIFALYQGSSLSEQITEAQTAFAEKYPTLGGVGKLLGFLAWVGGVFNTAISFMNWKSQDDTQKAGIITNCVSLVVGLAQMGIDLLNPWLEKNFQALQNAIAEGERLESVADEIIKELVPDNVVEATWRLEAIESALDLVDQETQKLAAPASWKNVFSKADVVAKVAAVAVTATTLVLNVIDFVRDILDGKPIEQVVEDGITAALTLGTLVVQIAELVVTSVVCTILSAAFAFLGVLWTIIQLFLPKPQTPTPAQTFQDQQAVPFTNSLPSAPPSTPTYPTNPGGIVLLDVELVYNLA